MMNLIPQTLSGPVVSALIGSIVVYWFGIRTRKIERRAAFREKQLSEFYSILAGYRQRISAKLEVEGKISNQADAAWKEICQRYSNSERPMENHDKLYEPFSHIIAYNNRQLEEETLPLYHKMLDLFTEKFWLADRDTRAHYKCFVEYIEIWDRYLAKSLPYEVLLKLNHNEIPIVPFFDHIAKRLEELQTELKGKQLRHTKRQPEVVNPA